MVRLDKKTAQACLGSHRKPQTVFTVAKLFTTSFNTIDICPANFLYFSLILDLLYTAKIKQYFGSDNIINIPELENLGTIFYFQNRWHIWDTVTETGAKLEYTPSPHMHKFFSKRKARNVCMKKARMSSIR